MLVAQTCSMPIRTNTDFKHDKCGNMSSIIRCLSNHMLAFSLLPFFVKRGHSKTNSHKAPLFSGCNTEGGALPLKWSRAMSSAKLAKSSSLDDEAIAKLSTTSTIVWK